MQMREAISISSFDDRPGFHGECDGYQRNSMVLVHNHFEPVRKVLLGDNGALKRNRGSSSSRRWILCLLCRAGRYENEQCETSRYPSAIAESVFGDHGDVKKTYHGSADRLMTVQVPRSGIPNT